VSDDLRIHVLARAAGHAPATGVPADPSNPRSILSLTATSYGTRPSAGVTIPTGFDPGAVALFETIVEAAYLVANADGSFDDEERRIFERIVVEACRGIVTPQQIAALVCDLANQLRDEGVDRRVRTLAAGVSKREHALEVVRIASLIAQVSGGASAVELDVLSKIALSCGLHTADVDAAIRAAKTALEAGN
jgi:tellurite resistance protein